MPTRNVLTCLVIMPFDTRLRVVYDNLYQNVCDSLKLKCYRLDDMKFMKPGHISKDMLEQIEDADIIIADTTSNNPNVFYELGYAHKTNFTNVILTRSKNDGEFPFDIKDFRGILYDRDRCETAREILKITITNILSDKSSPDSSVSTFYKKLAVKEYKRAWEYVAPEFKQSRWCGEVKKFIAGYLYTLSISHLHISPLSKEGVVAKFHVSYIEEVNAPVFPALRNFSRKTFSDIDSLKRDIEDLKYELTKNGFDSSVIDNLTFSQLVSPNRGSIIAWLLSKGSNSKPEQLFKLRNLARQHVCVEVILSKQKEQWLISKIRLMDFE